MEDTTLFGWIHLSDIHVGHGDKRHGWNQRLVMSALLRDIAARPGPARVDSILVTGDIAFSGAGVDANEYSQAYAWLREVAGAARIDPPRIWTVPGNHDVDRGADKDRQISRLVEWIRMGKETIDAALADPTDRALLTRRMQKYLEFAGRFAPWCHDDAPPEPEQRIFWTRRIRVHPALCVRLVGLNTALLCRDDADLGNLQLGNDQLADALYQPVDAEGEVVVVLSHHPLHQAWLSDEKEVYRWIRNHAHIHLSGHVHEAESGELRAGHGAHFVHVVAGAVHGEQRAGGVPASHGYNFAELVHTGGGQLELRVWPRRWSETAKGFRLDVDSVPNGKQFATHQLHLRLFPAAPLTVVAARGSLAPQATTPRTFTLGTSKDHAATRPTPAKK